MKNCMRSLQGAVLLFVCLSSRAWADDTLTLTTAGSGSVMGGVYTSPYGITVNGTPTLLICDDFTTDISIGQSWLAAPNTLTQVNSSTVTTDNLKFPTAAYPPDGNTGILGGNGTQPTDNNAAAYDYAVEAVLAAEIEQIPNVGTPSESSANATISGELSYAMWSVFDQALYTSLNSTGSTGWGSLTPDEVTAVDNDLAYAEGLVNAATSGGTLTNGLELGGTTNLNSISVDGHTIESMTIYTPSPISASQEFITVSMAEPSYPRTLGLDLLAALAVLYAFRRRLSGLVN